jgi:PAS domain S-box-containing protein
MAGGDNVTHTNPHHAESEIAGEKTLKVLLVEDSASDAALLQRSLLQTGYAIQCKRVETAEAFEAASAAESWDIVISDFSLPQFDAPSALKILRQRDHDIPFIIVSGQIGEETAVEMMKAGANDYLMKNNLLRLAPAIERELREAHIRRENRRAGEALRDSEAQYRAVAETALDAIITTDQAGFIVACNHGAQAMFGYTTEQLIGYPIHLVIRGPIGEWYRDRVDPAVSENISPTGNMMEIQGMRKSGDLFPLELSFAGWETAKGKFFTSIIREITERVHAQEQMKRQVEYLTALRTIDSMITASFDPHLTFNIILEQAIAHLGVDAAEILLMDPLSRRLDYTAVSGFLTNHYLECQPDLNNGYAARVMAEGCTVQISAINATQGDSNRGNMFSEEGFESYFGAPLITKGHVKGVLGVFHRSSLRPDSECVTFLESLTSQAAIAMDTIGLIMELQQSSANLAIAYDATLEGWSRALDLRDKETEGHSLRVTEMSVRLAKEMGLSEEAIAHLRRGAILHDIGKLGIPDRILLKPGELTEEERVIMRRHPVYSYTWLSPIVYLQPALDIPYCHHEKWDGSGYPRGLQGEAIPLAARIFSIVDVWDALRSERPYRVAWSSEKTREYISAMAGSYFDPTVAVVFLKNLSQIVTSPL